MSLHHNSTAPHAAPFAGHDDVIIDYQRPGESLADACYRAERAWPGAPILLVAA